MLFSLLIRIAEYPVQPHSVVVEARIVLRGHSRGPLDTIGSRKDVCEGVSKR